MAYTSYHYQGGNLAPGDFAYSNANNPILRVRHDTVMVHDMTYMPCNPGFYKDYGLEGHRNCAENIAGAIKDAGFGDKVSFYELPDPWNLFQNTPMYSLKGLGTSHAGDFIEMEALMDCLVAVSACPFETDGFNGGVSTDILVAILD